MDAKGIWRKHKGIMAFVALMLVFRSAVADWHGIPSSSADPVWVAGACVLTGMAVRVVISCIDDNVCRPRAESTWPSLITKI